MAPHSMTTIHPAAEVLRADMPVLPTVALVCGSGFVQALQSYPLAVWNVADLPAMPPISVKGHGMTVELHMVLDVPTLVFTGRYHLYEGHSDGATMTQIDVARSLGVTSVILTNASGGLLPSLERGDVIVMHDMIDATSRPMPLVQHASMRAPLDEYARTAVTRALRASNLPFREGTYAQVVGPTYETRAEVRMLRFIGADVVGMSTVREALYAARHGLTVVALSLVTNIASDVHTPIVDHQHVLQLATQRAAHVAAILETAIRTVGTPTLKDVSLRP